MFLERELGRVVLLDLLDRERESLEPVRIWCAVLWAHRSTEGLKVVMQARRTFFGALTVPAPLTVRLLGRQVLIAVDRSGGGLRSVDVPGLDTGASCSVGRFK